MRAEQPGIGAGVARVPVALSIAGSDPSGGAGIQADLKTFSALGVYGAAAVTALTAQNSRGVTAVVELDPGFVSAELLAVLGDLRVDAVKIGMLGGAATIEAVAAVLSRFATIPVVLDPVMVAKSGAALLKPAALLSLRRLLVPRAALLTPNLPEAAALLEESEDAVQRDPRRAAERLLALGPGAVLLKGGHAGGERSDDLFFDGREWLTLPARRLDTPNTHGTGCTLSAAVAAGLSHGQPLAYAVAAAKEYLHGALVAGAALGIFEENAEGDPSALPARHGPLHHFFAFWPRPRKPE
jgi:hydroxymethylpyrimidine/phosphomethylpyrimidine kinase